MFFRKISNFVSLVAGALRPLRYALSIALGLALSYAVCLKLYVPQQIINRLLTQKAPQAQVYVGKISGLFPFLFSIDEIRVGYNIRLKNAKVRVRLQTLNANISVESGELVTQPSLEVGPRNFNLELPTLPYANVISTVTDFFKKNAKKLRLVRYVKSFKLEQFNINEQKCCIKFLDGVLLVRTSSAKLILKFLDQSFCNAEYALEFFGGKYKGNIQITEEDVTLRTQIEKHHISYLENSAAFINIKYVNVPRHISSLKTFFTEASRHLSTSSDVKPNAIHIPSDVPGFLRDQSIVTSGLVPRSVSREPARLISTLPENSETLRCTFSIPFCNISGTAALDKDLEVDIFRGIKIVNVEALPTLRATVCRKDDSAWSFDVAGDFFCQGQYSNKQLKVSDVQLKLGNIPIRSQNICIDFLKKLVSPVLIELGKYKIETSSFPFDEIFPSGMPEDSTQNRSPNLKWKMSKLSLANGATHFGNLNVEGLVENRSCVMNFTITPDTSVRPPLKKLNLSTQGTVKISANKIALTSLKIDSGKGNQIHAELEAQADAFSELAAAFFQLANKEPISTSTVTLKGRISGTFALYPISVFLNVGDLIAGTVSTNLDISGPLRSPRLNGTFTLQNGAYEHFNNGIVLKNVSLVAKGEGSALKITQVRLDDGTFKGPRPEYDVTSPLKRCAGGSGSFELFSSTRVFAPHLLLNLHCNFLQVAYGKLVKARASGILRMKGPVTGLSEEPMITGDISIDNMLVSTSTETKASDGARWTIREKGNITKVAITPVAQLTKKIERFSMKIVIVGNVVVQADDLKCFLTGSVTAKGTILRPYLVGEMTANPKLSGKYNLFGKLMNVERGRIIYDEQHINDPDLNLVLASKISANNVEVILAGRLSDVKISLKSSPPLSQEEILSLFLFGQGLNQISADQNCIVKAFSSHMLKGNPLRVLDSLRQRVKLDSIELVDLQDIFNGESSQIMRVGKRFRNMKVFLDQDLSATNKSKMTVRYDVTPEIGIDANLSTGKGSSGVGVQWTKKY
ncbi:MAG: translocation/assembly module TamB [Holosporales bacterium]|jgi:hypothetical protein|nr:translocation/assembly module TamB [Holosporales bacterium]